MSLTINEKRASEISNMMTEWLNEQNALTADQDEFICATWGCLIAMAKLNRNFERHLHVILKSVLDELMENGWVIPISPEHGGPHGTRRH